MVSSPCGRWTPNPLEARPPAAENTPEVRLRQDWSSISRKGCAYRSRQLSGEISNAASAMRLAVSVTNARREESIQP